MGSSAWRTFGFVVGSKATSSVRGVSEMDRIGRKEEGPSRVWKLDIRNKCHCDEKSSGGEERARNKGHCRKGRGQIAYKGGNERTHLLFGL